MDEPEQPPSAGTWWDRTRPWDLRVDRLMWWSGLAIAALLVAAVAGFAGSWSRADPLGLLLLVAALGWGLARWLQGGERATAPLAGWLVTIVEWLVIAAILRVLYREVVLAVFPDQLIRFGTTERLLLAPAGIALLMGLSGKLRMHRAPSVIAVLVILVGFAGSGDEPAETRQQALATAAQLERAAKTDAPVVIGEADGRNWVLPAPSGAQCQRTAIADQRRSVLGLKGRRLEARFEVCWDGDGHVVRASTDQEVDRGGEVGGVRAIRPYDPTPFGIGDQPDREQYPDASGEAAQQLRSEQGVQLRVTRRRGHRDAVAFVAAYELTDPRGPNTARDDADGAFDDSSGSSSFAVVRWRLYPFDIARGRAVDLVSARLDGRNEPDASIVRFTLRGRTVLANHRGVDGGR